MTAELDRMRDEGMLLFARYLEETTMTAHGVIPQHPPAMPPPCDAKYDDAAIFCQRDTGHDGPHEGVTWVTWPQEEVTRG